MSFFFKIRDLFSSPTNKLEEAGIKEGMVILDYGCGPGSYSIMAARLVGQSGKVHSLDIQPLAIKKVENRAKKNNLQNIETILSNCKTELPDKSIDTVLFYDTMHSINELDCVLKEFHRILKSSGLLFVDDHHFDQQEIISKVDQNDLFIFNEKHNKTYEFKKK
ncbi:MAG: class I SAM-dependent methyltransferase [Promethearchaeota archaeon]|nr:MAG: class I SAM-dependent methyltransferase [Candidatus Lokiarchaeota archaeon]